MTSSFERARSGRFLTLALLAIGAHLWLGSPCFAAEAGRLSHSPLRHFAPEVYGGGDQIFDLVVSTDGPLYLADPDESRVHRYDGARWTSIRLPRSPLSLAADPDGRIWVGCGGDLGFLEEVDGHMKYRSLAALLPGEGQPTERFTDVVLSSRGPLFSGESIYLLTDGAFETIADPKGSWFHLLTSDRERIFAAAENTLYELKGSELSELWSDGSASVGGVTVLDSGELLVTTRSPVPQVVKIDAAGETSTWSAESNRLIEGTTVGQIQRLNHRQREGHIAVGTYGRGVLIFDRYGHLVETVSTATGLGNDEVYGLTEDGRGNLWVASELGVSAIYLTAIGTTFSGRDGLPRGINRVKRLGDELFVVALSGLYRFSATSRQTPDFEPVAGFTGTDTWDVALIQEQPFVINDQGIFGIEHRRKVYDAGPLGFVNVGRDDLIMVVGNRRLEMARLSAARWERLYRYDLPGYGFSGLREKERVFWIRGAGSVLFRAEFPLGLEQPPEVLRFEPNRDWFGIDWIGGILTVWGEEGVFRLEGADSSSWPSWQSDSRFAEIDWQKIVRDPIFTQIREDLSGGVWIGGRHSLNRYRLENDILVAQPSVGLTSKKMGAAFLDSKDPDVLWLITPNGLLRFPFGTGLEQPRIGVNTRPILRRVSPNTRWVVPSRKQDSRAVTQLATGPYTLRFEFAYPAFEIAEFVEYRSQVENLEEEWSDWSTEAQRDLMNLPPGNYRFRMQARHLGQTLGETEESFRILPPWYRNSLWMTVFGLLVAGLLLGAFLVLREIARRRELRLEHDIEVLQELVTQRTKGLEGLSRRLESMAVTDPLTGLANRRFLDRVLPSDLAQAQRDHDPLAEDDQCLLLLLLDLDHFKQINDRYGHGGGDAVLREAAKVLNSNLRRSDYVTRIGGEEFAIVVRSAERRNAGATANRIVESFRNHDFSDCVDAALPVTCSVGFVVYPLQVDHDPGDIEQVMAIADACLYKAKNSGRDGWVGAVETRRLPELAMGPNGLESMVDHGNLSLIESATTRELRGEPVL